MSLQIASLNSGSNANCYYVGNNNEAVLIDAGLSCRETEKRMKDRGLEMEKIKAIFITHEHADHISGLTGLSRKFKLPVYITDSTMRNCPTPVEQDQRCSFEHAKSVSIGGLTILPFTKSHDADDPHSFVVSNNGINVGIITDIGFPCKQVLHFFSQCHAVFLESNYCPDMLANGHYPYHLQKRISSDRGHLSNAQALDLFTHYRSSLLQLLILSHLSKNNNRPDLVQQMFEPHARETQIFVASRYEASPVLEVNGKPHVLRLMNKPVALRVQKNKVDERQMSLF
jgi:phosphoribosyl 1,2-cyclic phosphodiesterase